MKLIKGHQVADIILEDLKNKISELKIKPTLAVILIGEDQASKIYVGLKKKAAEKIGMNFRLFYYNSDVEEKTVLDKIKELNKDREVSGIIVQLPLPQGWNKKLIVNLIDLEKDVDGFCDENQNLFYGKEECEIFPVFPKAIFRMIEFAIKENNLTGIREGVIICNSDDFGRVMQRALGKLSIQGEYVLKDDLKNNLEKIKKADVLVTACGVANILNSSMVKTGAIVVDGGIIKVDGKVRGDVDVESFENFDAFISPVPGGVGPMTVACLLENTFLAGVK
ncbi:MAG: bifunctional 5,10-methylenetetrahydrofolate dehydrogenase/5,10-methenyltetrahydrofolate cyclohydrolase [Candidatus Moraniibacteriota bacterium]